MYKHIQNQGPGARFSKALKTIQDRRAILINL